MLRIPAMRERLLVAVATAAGLAVEGCSRTPAARDRGSVTLAGAWQVEFRSASGPSTWVADCVMEQDVQQISGACTSGFDSLASLNGHLDQQPPHRLSFDLVPKRTADDAVTSAVFSVAGEVNDTRTQIAGTWRAEDGEGGVLSGPFAATRR